MERLIFLDVLRGLAVLWMIETHVVHRVLPPDWHRGGGLLHILYMSNGYVAVAFTFCAGAGFWFASQKKGNWKYFRRLLFILGVGYWLNTTPFSLHTVLRATPLELQQIFQCDILQVIGASMLLALLLFHRARFRGIIPWFSGLLALGIFLITPIEWATPVFRSLPAFLSMPLSPIPPAKFPLFPWMGYFLAGISLTSFLSQSKRPQRFAAGMALAALAAPFLIYYVKGMNFTYPGLSDPNVTWYPSPGHSFFRLSGVILVYCLLFLSNNKLNALSSRIRFLQVSGQESLQIYVSHILILYGSVFPLYLAPHIPSQGKGWAALLLFGLVTLFCFLLADAWRRFKIRFPQPASILIKGIVLLGCIFFFLSR